MYLGRIVEEGPVERVLGVRAHPYTRALLAAVPRVGAEHGEGARDHAADATTVGATLELPSPLDPPAGCHFHPRCPQATDVCRASYPPVTEFSQGHRVRCHWPQLDDRLPAGRA